MIYKSLKKESLGLGKKRYIWRKHENRPFSRLKVRGIWRPFFEVFSIVVSDHRMLIIPNAKFIKARKLCIS
jgi:hypothetical protein